jgi:ABC-type Fe3+ transport system permease subunit
LAAFVQQLPDDIEEASRIDGAGEWRVLRRVVVPLIRAGITSVVLVVFVISWCDFLNPLVLLNNPGRYTVTVALYTYIGQPGQTLWGQLLAFGLLGCVPPLLVIILAERYIVRGIAAGDPLSRKRWLIHDPMRGSGRVVSCLDATPVGVGRPDRSPPVSTTGYGTCPYPTIAVSADGPRW